jgi:hypothetical protein
MAFVERAKEYLARHSTDEAPPIEVSGGIKHQHWLCVNGAVAEISFGGELLCPPPSDPAAKIAAQARYWSIVAKRAADDFQNFRRDLFDAGIGTDEQLHKLRRLRSIARLMQEKAKYWADLADPEQDPGVKAVRKLHDLRQREMDAFRARVMDIKP